MTKETKVNLIPSLTWGYEKVNYQLIDLEDFDFKNSTFEIANKVPKDFHDNFNSINYGVSQEILNLNKELRNYENFYSFNGNEKVEKTINLDFDNNYISDLYGIEVKEGANATLLLDYRSDKNVKAYKNTVIKIKGNKNSKLKIIIIQRLSHLSKAFFSMVSDLDENANVDLVHIEIGSKESYANYVANIRGEKADSNIRTAYFLNDERKLDLGYLINHIGKSTTSDMVVNGVLKDFSKKRFICTLNFLRNCTYSKGNEEEFVTLLDPTVKNITVPLLLAREHDIEGNHAASVGRVDQEMLFYIRSRGFDELAAKKIIIESKVKPVLDLIEHDDIAKEIMDEILESID